jgi:hypothetical protein
MFDQIVQVEIEEVEKSDDAALLQLAELQLAVVGGGIGTVTIA